MNDKELMDLLEELNAYLVKAKNIMQTIASKNEGTGNPYIYAVHIQPSEPMTKYEIDAHCDGFENIVDFTEYRHRNSDDFPIERSGKFGEIKCREIGKWEGVKFND